MVFVVLLAKAEKEFTKKKPLWVQNSLPAKEIIFFLTADCSGAAKFR